MIAHIITGLSGSGKTTVSNIISEKEDSLIINTDKVREKIFENIDCKKNTFTQDQLGQVYKTIEILAFYLFSSNPKVKHIIFEGAFRNEQQRESIINIAKKLSIQISIIHVTAKDDIIKKRITDRFNSGLQAADFDSYLRLKKIYEKPMKCYSIDNSYNIDLLKNNIDNYLDSL
jgi:predicted kinase